MAAASSLIMAFMQTLNVMSELGKGIRDNFGLECSHEVPEPQLLSLLIPFVVPRFLLELIVHSQDHYIMISCIGWWKYDQGRSSNKRLNLS